MYKIITCSKHSIEEYINDNPKKTKTAEKSLIFLFKEMLYKKAPYHKWEKANIIRYKDQAIVYNDYHIITYYRIIHPLLSRVKKEILKKIDLILSWEAEKKHNKYVERQKEKIKKLKQKKARKNINDFNRKDKIYWHLWQCFK